MEFPSSLQSALNKREEENMLRRLSYNEGMVDFCSNDYLGFSRSPELSKLISQIQPEYGNKNGATGSRLISGNTKSFEMLEHAIAKFHNAQSALIYNSGYDANLGLLSSIGKKGDVFLYDELVHASLHDGMRLSLASYFKFKHNNIDDLRRLLQSNSDATNVYVVLESVYSMDGDSAPLKEIAELKSMFTFHLIVDEAHAMGVFGENGKGLCNQLGVEDVCFARVYTYGKAMGVHGAAIVGASNLRLYLINFSRSFIYTTALSPHAYASIDAAYKLLEQTPSRELLKKRILLFKKEMNGDPRLIPSESSIQCILIPGNSEVNAAASFMCNAGYDVRAIKSPTVKSGAERLRICLHAYNSENDIIQLCLLLKKLLYK